ncbi:hypothetical protein Lalb_Chr14g0365101 [Lupinus albus]|uniref:Uncharacterized protein n=1 Tax=Lupinus albus TaxID=3870 RepID=A0A6A4P9C6_LUPAL|nr:hypothetical protein Lalb_Chr14g0365101 [Lupinus albus]
MVHSLHPQASLRKLRVLPHFPSSYSFKILILLLLYCTFFFFFFFFLIFFSLHHLHILSINYSFFFSRVIQYVCFFKLRYIIFVMGT